MAMTFNPHVTLTLALGLAATAEDLWRRQISNWIPAAALVGGVAVNWLHQGWWGGLMALAGAVGGFFVFLVFYVLGGMGGGDVKLMAGFGALLGAGRLMEAALWTAGMGGLLALGVLGYRALRGKLAGGLPLVATSPELKLQQESIPYAPAIALGVWLSLVPKG